MKFAFRVLPARLLCLCFILLAATGLRAQQSPQYKDSLYRLANAPKDDSTKVFASIRYGEIFETDLPDTAEFYYKRALDISRRLGYKSGEAQIASYYYVVLTNSGRYEEALELCRNAVRIYEEKTSRPRELGIAYNNLGNAYQNIGIFKLATDYYIRSLEIATSQNDRPSMRRLENNLSSVFNSLEDFDKAYEYATHSYALARELRDTFGMASSLVNIGVNEIALKRYASAETHLSELVRLGSRLDDYTLVLDGQVNLGEATLAQGRFAEADRYFNTVLQTATEREDPVYRYYAIRGLMNMASERGDLREADAMNTRAIGIARELQANNELSDMLLKGSELKASLGETAVALAYLKEHTVLTDSILGKETRNNIRRLEVQFQTAQKDKSLAEQALQLERTKAAVRRRGIWLFLAGFGAVAAVVIAVVSWRFYRQRRRLLHERLQAIRAGQEVMRLKATMAGQEAERRRISREMHDDIGSGLTTIMYLSGGLQHETASPAASKISSITQGLVGRMNEIIWSMNKDYDTLEDLIIYLRQNTAELLSANGLDYEFSIPDAIPQRDIPGEQRRNIYLSVKESMHNIIKHAEASMVTMDVSFEPGLKIVVRDNGKGIDMETIRRFGNGLKNMRQRMESSGGTYEISGGGGTTSVFTAPL